MKSLYSFLKISKTSILKFANLLSLNLQINKKCLKRKKTICYKVNCFFSEHLRFPLSLQNSSYNNLFNSNPISINN